MSSTISEAASTTADPRSPFIRLNGDSGSQKRGLLDVELEVPVGVGASVLHADLILTQAEALVGSETLTVDAIADSWDPATVTWATAPTVHATTATEAVSAAGVAGTQVTIDVTSIIAERVAAEDASGERFKGLRLRTSATSEKKIYGSYAPKEYQPFIRVEYSQRPDTPFDLYPDAGLAVGDLRPYFMWAFTDPDAEDTLSAVQLQVATDSTFASTVYDSGEVEHTKPYFDAASPPTGAAAFSDLTATTTYYWRVKHRDNHGIWSDYSDGVSFVPTTKGDVTLSAPSSSSVTSPTPTVTWTFSETQNDYEVEVLRKVDGAWVTHYVVARTVGTATEVAVPATYALEEGESYKVVVRVWPATPFADLPGDRAFASDEQEFTLTGAA